MDLWIVVLTIMVGALCIYLFGTRNHNYFKKLGIPFVKPVPIFGNMSGIIFKVKSLVDIAEEGYHCHPEAKYVGFYDFSTPIILVRDPELVKSITIKNFDCFPNHKMFVTSPTEPVFQKNLFALQDDTWRDMRSVLSPSFTSSKMKMMYEIMSKCAIDFADHLAMKNSQPEELDVKEIFGRYSLDVIASTAFGLSVNSMKDRDNDFYLTGKEVADFSGLKVFKFFFMKKLPWLAKLLNIKFLDPKTTDFFKNVIDNTIATRDARGIVRPDMIHLMMQARDRGEKSSLTSDDITAQAFIFFLGGFDGPATAISFAAQMLVVNPDVQRKLQEEIDRVIEKREGPSGVTYEDLHAMKYLDGVVMETLRMFPPSPFLDRVGSKSFTLPPALPGLKPLKIEAGQSIWLPCYSFHHDPRYFPDPEKFQPERFSDENKSNINPLTYFPFGLGPRICIGNRFALMEVKLALFHVLAKCNLSPTPKTRSVIKLRKQFFPLIPEDGFQLKIKPRK